MKNMKKAFFIVLLLFNCLLFGPECAIKSSASVSIDTFSNGSDYLELFYGSYQNIMVTDARGDDVTDSFLTRTVNLFREREIQEIKNIIASEVLTLHTFSDATSYAYEQYKTVSSDMQYFILWDNLYSTCIEVTSVLSGGIWYNPNTDKVTKVSTPTYTILSLSTNAVGIELYSNNFKTGSSVVSGKGYFWGQCSFGGKHYDSKVGTTTYNYGSKKVSFYATP